MIPYFLVASAACAESVLVKFRGTPGAGEAGQVGDVLFMEAAMVIVVAAAGSLERCKSCIATSVLKQR